MLDGGQNQFSTRVRHQKTAWKDHWGAKVRSVNRLVPRLNSKLFPNHYVANLFFEMLKIWRFRWLKLSDMLWILGANVDAAKKFGKSQFFNWSFCDGGIGFYYQMYYCLGYVLVQDGAAWAAWSAGAVFTGIALILVPEAHMDQIYYSWLL